MSRYDTYTSNASEAPLMRKWVFWALALSLLLHGGLFAFFQYKKLENFTVPEERLAPPIRVFKRVAIPEMPKDPEDLRVKMDKTPKTDRITVPSDKPQVQDVRLSPQVTEMPKLPMEKPKADPGGADLLAKVEAATRGQMDKDLSTLAGSLMKEGPKSPRQPVLKLPTSDKVGDGLAGDREGIPGLKTIDEALAVTGPLPVGDKPIGMPGGALYEYDSADLKAEAIAELQKLGELIQRNPKATFSIEGHTDSFGGPDYNARLSERRAEAVKVWLVQNMGVAPERIQTRGLGNTKWIVPPGKSIEEQAPNRRVEIVIKTNRR
jgi:outer membrane protein OmpA-like peptidoglycan-associated protein